MPVTPQQICDLTLQRGPVLQAPFPKLATSFYRGKARQYYDFCSSHLQLKEKKIQDCSRYWLNDVLHNVLL